MNLEHMLQPLVVFFQSRTANFNRTCDLNRDFCVHRGRFPTRLLPVENPSMTCFVYPFLRWELKDLRWLPSITCMIGRYPGL